MASIGVARLRPARAATLASLLLLVLLAASLLAGNADARVLGSARSTLAAAETAVPPKITKQPTNKTVNEGENASFESTASGTPTPSEQWEVSTNGGASWSAIEGATTSVLTVTAVQPAQNGNLYRAHFANTAGAINSNGVTLTVHYKPIITEQTTPKEAVVLEGENATFKAGASANPAPSVKWEVSTNGGSTWAIIKEATATTLTITAAKTTQSGNEYRATFTNSLGKTSTEPATLVVNKAPAITKQPPEKITATEGENVTIEATASGFPAPAVQWEVSTNGGVSWTELPGATSTPLVLEGVTHEQDGNEYRASFANVAGTATTSATKLTVLSPPKVTLAPQNAIILVGESATFEAAANGFPTPTVQWEVSTNGGSTFTPIEGATSDQYTVTNAQASQNNSQYRATFTNEAGKTSSAPAVLTVATTNYNALAWGQNLYRQLGNGSNNAEFDVPVPVSGLKFVVSVAAGARHSLALIASGNVDAWGFNESGQLGNGGTSTSSTPVEVPGLSHVKAIAAGAEFSLALTSSGAVESWGANESGQLGNGTNERSLVPVAVKGLSGVTAIAAGAEHGLALLSNGTVKAWGSNTSGQLGDGTLKSSSAPVAVKGLSNVTAIAAGEGFSLALLSNGTVKAWGANTYGQLGNAEVEEDSNVPVAVASLTGVNAIAAGATHALAIVSGGSVMAWGEDKFGELGNGTTKTSEVKPVAVTGITGASAVSAGLHDSAAIVNGGTVMTWGVDEWGQLGNGKVGAGSNVPVTVLGVTKAASLSAGSAHVLAFGEPTPVVTEVSPAFGTSAGGTSVTVSGTDLGGASEVKFGASAATSFTVNSSTSITAIAPPQAPGTVDVTVTTPAGTSGARAADHYTFEGPPTVSKLLPREGASTGGTTVTITGTEFAGASGVSFGSTPAAKFTINSNTSITATAPAVASPALVHVAVTNVNSTSAPSSKDLFKFTPIVASVTPNGGPAAGGTSVTVTGTGFVVGSGLTRFLFGKAKATSVVCASTTECTMISPAGVAGTVNVIAEVNKVKSPASPADAFTYS